MKPLNPITIVIADDHPLLRDGIKTFFGNYPQYQIIGEASNGIELVSLAENLKPKVIITDIQMPKMDGVQATKVILNSCPGIKIIAISFLDNEYAVVDMLEAGAVGYLYKGGASSELLDAVETVCSGQHYFSIQSNPALMEKIARSNYQPFLIRDAIELSDRELQIIKLLCQNQTSTELADTLTISKRTVDVHLQHIYKKIGVNNACGVITYAIRNGIYVFPTYQKSS